MTTTAPPLDRVVDALVRTPVADLRVSELQAHIALVGGARDRLDGRLSAACGELQARTGGALRTDDGGSRSVTSWLAEVRCESPSAVGSSLRTSTALRSLPLVADAVVDGLLTPGQAAVLARLVGRVPDADLAEAEPQLVLVAARLDPAQLAAYVRLIATHCEPLLDDDAEPARRRRFLQTARQEDGSVRGRFLLPAEQAEALLASVEARARRQGLGDERTAGQRRADALAELAELDLRHGDLPEHGGHRPQISYVMPADWAARQGERDRCPSCSTCAEHRPPSLADTVAAGLPGQPGVPAEHGCATAAWTSPATRPAIEALLCDARISRVLLDPLDQVRGLEALRDSVTKAQRRVLAARDLGCAARGCTRPPAMCDAHHLRARADVGATTLGNLVFSAAGTTSCGTSASCSSETWSRNDMPDRRRDPDERDAEADRRDAVADERDRLSAAGDLDVARLIAAADLRDQAAERRDRAAEARDEAADARGNGSEADLAAARDRGWSATDRAHSGMDRDRGAEDRVALAEARAGAAERRDAAAGARVESALDRSAAEGDRAASDKDREAAAADRADQDDAARG